MTELLPCPFCGGEAEVVREIADMWIVECTKCGALVDGIEAWNRRYPADLEAVPVTEENMKRHGWVRERTCRLERHGSLSNIPSNFICWSCSECGFGWHHSENDKQFSYCPNCGAKVVE